MVARTDVSDRLTGYVVPINMTDKIKITDTCLGCQTAGARAERRLGARWEVTVLATAPAVLLDDDEMGGTAMMQPPVKHSSPRSRSGLRPVHGLVVAGTVLVAVLVAYAALSFIVGTFAFFVKLLVVVAIFALVVRLVRRHARS